MYTDMYNTTSERCIYVPKRPEGRPRRFKPKEDVKRIVLNLSEAEDSAFREAIAKLHLGTITNTFLVLIEGLCKEAGVKWPKVQR